MELSHTRGQATVPSNRLVQLLRRHPLVCYFLLAFGFSWAYELTVFRVLFTPSSVFPWVALLYLGFLVGPTLAAFLMTAVTEGRAGIRQLLRHYVLWRVGLSWYLLILLGIPALLLLAVLLLPGALSAFRLPGLSFWPIYLIGYLLFVLPYPVGEEPGWRGFALPRLEQRSGPLLGTLLLGVLWGLWHLPLFFIPGTFQYAWGEGLVGRLISIVPFVIWIMAWAVVSTWVFNNTRGSLLLAFLLHSTVNYAFGLLTTPGPTLFPSLTESPLFFRNLILVWVVAALLVIVATRGRLSYQRYQRETALPAPVTAPDQAQDEAGTSG